MAARKRKSNEQKAVPPKKTCKKKDDDSESSNEKSCTTTKSNAMTNEANFTLGVPKTEEPAEVEQNSNHDPSSSDCSDWEEVEENEAIGGKSDDDKEPVIPKEGVEITLQLPNARQKRPKKDFNIQAYFRRQVNRFKRDVQEAMHQVHLLCLLSHGFYVHRILNKDIVRAVAFSMIPTEFHKPRGKAKWSDIDRLDHLQRWFGKTFQHDNNGYSIDSVKILNGFHSRRANCSLIYCCMFLVCVRMAGYDARLVLSFHPLPLKPNLKLSTNGNKKEQDLTNKPDNITPASKACPDEQSQKIPSKPKKMKAAAKTTEEVTPRRRSSRPGRAQINYDEDVTVIDDETEEKHQPFRCQVSSGNKPPNEAGTNKKRASSKKSTSVPLDPKPAKQESDDDFEVEVIRISNPGPSKGLQRNRKAVSPNNSTSKGRDHWIEVYVQSAKQWYCVDCIAACINRPQDIEKSATNPLSYVLAFDIDGHVKDVTRRYASDWLVGTRKLRVNPDWWAETLQPYCRSQNSRDKLEDEELEEGLMRQPLPTSVSMLKSHPLYALKRHLLKFEGIYPPEAVPVGFIRGEAIYSRVCVRTLHSRETWLKEARLVKRGETPYKVVKARPKWNRGTGEFETDLPLELFGEWQTEEYVAPPAQDGKVPRNDYGNVELFKPSMLPKGTVHLQIPALNRVAKKLGIDCAPAMTGWDFHGMGSHPVFDGWVVCEEFKDTLLDAWNQEQAVAEEREKQKREKRVYGNWRRLIRGLLIQEKVRIKYALGPPVSTEESVGMSQPKQQTSTTKRVKSRKKIR